jgi:hypothetical protein
LKNKPCAAGMKIIASAVGEFSQGDKTAPFYFQFTTMFSTAKYLSKLSSHGYL